MRADARAQRVGGPSKGRSHADGVLRLPHPSDKWLPLELLDADVVEAADEVVALDAATVARRLPADGEHLAVGDVARRARVRARRPAVDRETDASAVSLTAHGVPGVVPDRLRRLDGRAP